MSYEDLVTKGYEALVAEAGKKYADKVFDFAAQNQGSDGYEGIYNAIGGVLESLNAPANYFDIAIA